MLIRLHIRAKLSQRSSLNICLKLSRSITYLATLEVGIYLVESNVYLALLAPTKDWTKDLLLESLLLNVEELKTYGKHEHLKVPNVKLS